MQFKLIETDNGLISRIVDDNDRDAASELINKYYNKVYKEIYMKVQDEELALDLTQETFISMLNGLKTFDYNKASFKTWLIKIADNKVIDHYRSRRHHENILTEILEDYDEEDKTDVEKSVMGSMTLERIDNLLKKESSEDRDIFYMKARQGCTFDEISLKLNINCSTVKSRYYAIVRKMSLQIKSQV